MPVHRNSAFSTRSDMVRLSSRWIWPEPVAVRSRRCLRHWLKTAGRGRDCRRKPCFRLRSGRLPIPPRRVRRSSSFPTAHSGRWSRLLPAPGGRRPAGGHILLPAPACSPTCSMPLTGPSIASVTGSRTCSAAQGLALHPRPIRPLRPHFHVSHLHRRNLHLLARSMRPESSCEPA